MADTKLDKQLKLSGALPGEDRENGIDHLAPYVVENPEGTLVFAVAILDAKSVTHDIPSGADVPLMRIREIEGALLDDVPTSVREWMQGLRDARRSDDQEPLPDELDEELADHLDARQAATVAVVPHDADAVVLHPFANVLHR